MQNQAPNVSVPPGTPVVVGPNISTPNAVYKAFNAARKELGNQLDQLEEKRNSLQGELREGNLPAGISRAGVETRIGEIDKQIADIDKAIAAADKNVVTAAAVPGAVLPERPQNTRNGPPEGVFIVSSLFIVVVLLPISIAIAKRIWRRGAAAVTAFPQELTERLDRLDQSVDSIAIEVERIGEGQRFVTRVMSESGRALGAGAALPIETPARDKARERGSM
jgi:prefoldin subunit 5